MMRSPAARPASSNSFVPDELFGMLGNLSRADMDRCDFGVIKLDDSGKVVMVNRYQSDLGGVAIPNFENKHYFTQIAPCTNNALFFGSFKKGVAANNLNLVFPYTFTFKMKPTNVKVHLYRDQATKTNWVFCARA
ncbi:MAG: photoactive yellow protein [Planctomycetota bacterium]|nr:photoactive yellow protein [Planctomycetota bacterium]